MGHRELRRVPLDFAHPINRVWDGYINPFRADDCTACDGGGYNPETKQLYDDYYDFANTGRKWCYDITQDEVQALVDGGRLWDFTLIFGENGWEDKVPPYIPTAAEVNLWASPATRGFGHDSINCWILVETRAKRLGVWGRCEVCDGDGEIFASPELERLYNEWNDADHEPPTGEGYQLWETVTEGSPQSPVFETAEELAEWCVEGANVFAGEHTTYENWLNMFQEDSEDVGSMFITSSTYQGAVINEPKT